jgi:beta-barrel assembly-enhancing protease
MIARRLVAAALAIALPMQAATAQEAVERRGPAPALIENLRKLIKHEERVTTIGERLAVAAAAAGWCTPVPSAGWTLGDLGMYPKALRPTVRRHFGLPTDVSLFVSSIAPDGAAAQAGVRPGMGVSRIGDAMPVRFRGTDPSRGALASNERLVARSLSEGPLSLEVVATDGTRNRLSLSGRAACPSRFEVSAQDEENAFADGDVVVVTAGMAHITRDSDEELAGVIAHELAHNMLRHIPRSEEAGTPDDYTRYLNRYSRISREMEQEADRLSVWLLAAAGFDPEAPIRFWQRFGPGNDGSPRFGRLHDRWPVRVAAIEDELAIMRAAKHADPAARPALLDRATVVPVPGTP